MKLGHVAFEICKQTDTLIAIRRIPPRGEIIIVYEDKKIICLDFITVQRYANAVGLYAMAPSLPSVTSWCYSQMAKHTCIIQTTSHSSRESLVS